MHHKPQAGKALTRWRIGIRTSLRQPKLLLFQAVNPTRACQRQVVTLPGPEIVWEIVALGTSAAMSEKSSPV